MVELKKGMLLIDIKKGEGKSGSWALCKVKAEKGYDSIDVWCANPEDVGNEPMKLGEIISVKKTARKYEKDGVEKWADVYSVNARFEIADSMNGFSKLNDEDCPF